MCKTRVWQQKKKINRDDTMCVIGGSTIYRWRPAIKIHKTIQRIKKQGVSTSQPCRFERNHGDRGWIQIPALIPRNDCDDDYDDYLCYIVCIVESNRCVYLPAGFIYIHVVRHKYLSRYTTLIKNAFTVSVYLTLLIFSQIHLVRKYWFRECDLLF